MSHSILTNTIIASLGRVSTVGAGLVATALITRYLGPEVYGIYTLLFAYGAILQLLADGGLYLTLTREIARAPEYEGELLRDTLVLRGVLLTTVFLLGLVIVLIVPGWRPYFESYLLAAVALLFQSAGQLLMGVYQKHGEVWRVTLGDIVGRFIQIGCLWFVGRLFLSLPVATGIFLLSTGVTLIVQLWLLPITLPRLSSWTWSAWRRLLLLSWPVGAMLLLNAIYFRVGALLLSLFRAEAEVGYYGLAFRFIESGLFFPAMFGGLLLPRLTGLWYRQQRSQSATLLAQGIYGMLLVIFIVVPLLVIVAPWLVLLVAGPAFAPASALLKILTLALAAMCLGNIFGFTLIALESQRKLLKLYAGLAIMNTILNMIFVPLGGAVAVAWIAVITEVLASGTAAWWVYRRIPFTLPWSSLIQAALLASMLGVMVWWLSTPLTWWWVAGGAFVLYPLALVCVGALSPRRFTLLLTRM